MLHATGYKIIPHNSRADTQGYGLRVFGRHFDTSDAGMQYQPVVVFGKQQIAAAANMQKRCRNGTLRNILLQFRY